MPISRHASPAPTYTSDNWPLTPIITSTSPDVQNPTSHSDMKQNLHQAARTIPPVQPDHADPSHPHFPNSFPPTHDHLPSRHHIHGRWPQKRILIPWLLALLFFLTTLCLTSIALGVRFLNMNKTSPPVVQEIKVYVNGIEAEGTTQTMSLMNPVGPTPSTSAEATSTIALTTGRLHLAQTGAPELSDLERSGRKREEGFVTFVRRV